MKALVVVDVQKDFCEKGLLAVRGGNAVAQKIAEHIDRYGDEYEEIIFTKDWHNPWPDTNGGHFAEEPDYVDTWPIHCVANTTGSMFHPALPDFKRDCVFYKGLGVPDYSGFQGRNYDGLLLGWFLKIRKITDIDVVGIAGDYCVRHTALDGVKEGLKVEVLPSMVASVGGENATKSMLKEVDSAQRVR